tara:strand:- start:102 stop:521 length:420 start_codon:yes stop_codon:yes gene_type:complete
MTKETQKNNGNPNNYIKSYCKELFPTQPKKIKKIPEDYEELIEGTDYRLSFNVDGVMIENLSNNKTIYSFQSYDYGDYRRWDSDTTIFVNDDERCAIQPEIDLTNRYNRITSAITPRNSSSRFYRDKSYSCMMYSIKGK